MSKIYKIRELTVSEPDQKQLAVDLTIADAAEAEQITESLVASVTIPREGLSLENIQLTALDRIRELFEQARATVNSTSDKIQRKEL